jgi:hypothetical protein
MPSSESSRTLDQFLQYVVWLGKIDKEMESYRKAAMTPTFRSSSEWLKFKRQVNTQLQTYRSLVMKYSLCYVMLGEDYLTIDADLYMTAELEGPQFESDNKRVMELLTARRGSVLPIGGCLSAALLQRKTAARRG